MDTNREELQIKVVFSSLCQGLLKGFEDRDAFLLIAFIIIAIINIIIIITIIIIIIILSILSQQLLLIAGFVFYVRPLFQLKTKKSFDNTNY